MKPKLIGITGGIGAGKSTVSTICKHLGFKVYNSDQRGNSIQILLIFILFTTDHYLLVKQ